MMKDANDAVKAIDAENAKAEEGEDDSGVKDAQDKLASEITSLEDCQKHLKEAKDKLKKLMAEKEAKDKANKDADDAAKKKFAKDKADADAMANLSEEEAKKLLDKAKKDAEKAKDAREEVDSDEKALEEAKQRLKKLRAKQIADHSAISRVEPDAGPPGCVCPGGAPGTPTS